MITSPNNTFTNLPLIVRSLSHHPLLKCVSSILVKECSERKPYARWKKLLYLLSSSTLARCSYQIGSRGNFRMLQLRYDLVSYCYRHLSPNLSVSTPLFPKCIYLIPARSSSLTLLNETNSMTCLFRSKTVLVWKETSLFAVDTSMELFTLVQAEEEVCRLARESGRLMAAKSPNQVNHLSSEQSELEAKLGVCERKLEELSLLIGSNQQVRLTFSPPNAPLSSKMPIYYCDILLPTFKEWWFGFGKWAWTSMFTHLFGMGIHFSSLFFNEPPTMGQNDLPTPSLSTRVPVMHLTLSCQFSFFK